MSKELSEMSLDEINENYVVMVNIECDYILGFMEVDKANEIFSQYKDPFPLAFEPLIDERRQDKIDDNCILSEDKVRRNIYEEVFDENNNVKPQYLAKDGD